MVQIEISPSEWNNLKGILYREENFYPTYSFTLGRKDRVERARRKSDDSTVLEYRYEAGVLCIAGPRSVLPSSVEEVLKALYR